MTRSIWKGPFCEVTTEANKSLELNNHINRRIYSRRSIILPQFVGQTFSIHNGKTFISCKIVENMIGLKFGQFASTRSQTKKNINKTNNKAKATKATKKTK